MVFKDGCNVKIPGTRGAEGRTEPFGYENSKTHVVAGKPWYRENLKYSIARRRDPEKERKLQEDMAKVEEAAVEMREWADKFEEAKERRERARVEFEEVMIKTEANIKESQEFLAKLQKTIEDEALPPF
ncbi:hypothetical protein F4818DRAFT_18920 [Hypoxylon cercidicola]|nr:hypothetical protein F4818DRAFT_18920 [Hypoxylon cercidicola]